MREHLLSAVLLVPMAGAVACLALPSSRPDRIRWVAAVAAFAGLALAVPLWAWFDPEALGYQFVEEAAWMPEAGVAYRLGLDGVSLLLVLLTLLLLPLVLLASWRTIQVRVKEYHVVLLLLQVGMLGVFASLDAFLFYVFWEVMLVPMYFLIGVWGGQNRVRAAVKFFLYTIFGSVLMLLALLWLWSANGRSFDMTTMEGLALPVHVQHWLFAGFFLAFAIKVPMFPFHTWLPDAHGEAPTGGSVILAGVLLKMGTYGFVRFAIPMLPDATRAWLPALLVLSVIGIVYGALTAMAQQDVKQLVAYSSVSHLGFVMLGVFCLNPNGLSGGLLQMVNHGISTGALFLLVGILYERRHTKRIADFGGIASSMPLYATIFVIVTMSSIGLPALNGFVGELMILIGSVELALQGWHWMVLVAFAASGVVLGAAYMLWMTRRVLFGPVTHRENERLSDVKPFGLEFWSLAPLVALCFWIGLYPKPFLAVLDAPVAKLVAVMDPHYHASPAVADVLPSAARPSRPVGGHH
jgi:NADH-quinone oxidoreductase subunit M